MSIQNDFLTFAAAAGANVLTQAEYAAASATATGYQTGTASSAAVNKSMRQSSIMASMIANFIVAETGQTVIDDGTTATIQQNFVNAILAVAQTMTITIPQVQGLQIALNGKLSTTGNAASASKLAAPVTISLGGVVTGAVNFDGSQNVTITTSTALLAALTGAAFTGGISAPTVTSNGNFVLSSPTAGLVTGTTQGMQILWNTLASGSGRLEYVNNHGSNTGGHFWFERQTTSNTAVQTMSLDASGNLNVVSSITTAGNVTSGQSFVSSTTNAVLASGSTGGGVFLRPQGVTSSVGQVWIDSVGNMHCGATVYAGANFTSTTTGVYLSSSASGGFIALNPNGPSSATGQLLVLSNGNVTATGTISAPGISVSGNTVSNTLNTNSISTVGIAVTGIVTPTAQGLYLQWNQSGGQGEADFVNNEGGGSGGFNFYNTSGAGGTLTKIVTISGTGKIVANGGFQNSDRRLKKNIARRDVQRGLALQLANHFSEWDMRLGGGHDQGLIAQDVNRIASQYVLHPAKKGDYLAIDKAGLALEASMDNALHLKELDTRIQALEKAA